MVRVGVDYDLWLDRLLRQTGNAAIQRGAPGHIDASTDVALLDVRAGGIDPGDGHAHGRGNPHYWLDPVNAEMITATLLESLARIDPPNARQYEANRLAFLARLDAKMREWTHALRNAPPLIAYHDTWPYFARRFRLSIQTVVLNSVIRPMHAARLKMLTTARANAVSHCSHSGDRYCKNYAEEQYRRDKRGLDKEFGELDPEDKLEKHDHEKKIFDRGR